MTDLISRLAEQIIKDEALFFIDASLSPGPNQLSLAQQIAESLARRIDYQGHDQSLTRVARDYAYRRDPNYLIRSIQEELTHLANQPAPTYEYLAQILPLHAKIITTQFDDSLERALDQCHKPYEVILHDTDVPFFNEACITLIKLQGDINQPSSLRIAMTANDFGNQGLQSVSDVVRALFATKTVIFLGGDLSNSLFESLYLDIFNRIRRWFRRAYAIIPPPLINKELEGFWRERNLEIYSQYPPNFLKTLGQAIITPNQKAGPPPSKELAAPPPEYPYKALASFTQTDEAIFFGRTEQSHRLKNRILVNRLTVLYGESGSGKTSLLQAGVGPLLAKKGKEIPLIVCSFDFNAPSSLLEQIYQALIEADWPVKPSLSGEPDIYTFIREWQKLLDKPLVLSIDHFERLFVSTGQTESEAAKRRETLHILHNLFFDTSLNIHLVLVIREDFLGHLDGLADMPNLLNVRFRLEKLEREAARSAIEEPAKLFNFTWEQELVNRLLDDLYKGGSGYVAPPQLQIVCNSLYEKFVHSTKRAGKLKITLADFEREGGTEAILRQYLDQIVAEFDQSQQPTVRRLLGALVDPNKRIKRRLPLAELAQRVQLKPAQTAALLDRLTQTRVLQRYGEDQSARTGRDSFLEYELVHDYLAAQVAGWLWLDRDFWEQQKARDLLNQALPDWKKDKRLLAPDDLHLITKQRRHLHFSEIELELIYGTAVAFDDPTAWEPRLQKAVRQEILLQLLKHPGSSARRQAARTLALFPRAQVAITLAQAAWRDAEPPVRENAAQAIAHIINESGVAVGKAAINQLVQAVESGDSPTARQALIIICDRAPEGHALLPPKLKPHIRQSVWSVRRRRHWPEILDHTRKGLLGGILGGMALVGFTLDQDFRNSDIQTIINAFALILFILGVIGAITTAVGNFAGSFWRGIIEDYPQPILRWLVVTLASTVSWILLLLALFNSFAQGEGPATRSPWETIIIGLTLGLGLIGLGTIPLKIPRPVRLGLAIIQSMVIVWLVGFLFFSLGLNSWWLAPLGGIAGMSFFWAMEFEDEISPPDKLALSGSNPLISIWSSERG